MANKRSAVDRAFNAWSTLTETERVEFDAFVRGFARGRGQQQPEPVKKLGRPVGSKNAPKPSKVNGVADESILGFQLGDGPA